MFLLYKYSELLMGRFYFALKNVYRSTSNQNTQSALIWQSILLIKPIFPFLCIDMTSTCLSQISGTSCDYCFMSKWQALNYQGYLNLLVTIHHDIFIPMSFLLCYYLMFSQKWGCRAIFKSFYIVAFRGFFFSFKHMWDLWYISCIFKRLLTPLAQPF